jgi:hypothetical protein
MDKNRSKDFSIPTHSPRSKRRNEKSIRRKSESKERKEKSNSTANETDVIIDVNLTLEEENGIESFQKVDDTTNNSGGEKLEVVEDSGKPQKKVDDANGTKEDVNSTRSKNIDKLRRKNAAKKIQRWFRSMVLIRFAVLKNSNEKDIALDQISEEALNTSGEQGKEDVYNANETKEDVNSTLSKNIDKLRRKNSAKKLQRMIKCFLQKKDIHVFYGYVVFNIF